MKRNNLSYFVREGVRGIFLNGFMSFAAVGVILACLVIMGSFTLLLQNINSMVKGLEQENEILAFVDDSLTEQEARNLEPELSKVQNVLSCDFISNTEAMESFETQYSDSSIFEGLDASTFRSRYVIRLVDIEYTAETKAAVEQISGIAKVNAHLEIAQGFLTLQRIINVVSYSITIILLIVSIFIISNTVKLAMFARREEIAIMKMVGATNGFIRWPFVFEGMLLGLTGAVIAFFAQWGLYVFVVKKIEEADTIKMLTLLPFEQLMVPLMLAFAAAGFLVGIGGSVLTIRKFLKV